MCCYEMKNKLNFPLTNLNQKKPVGSAFNKIISSPLEKGSGVSIGIIGAGSFAAFAAKAFLKVQGIKIMAVADVNETSGQQLASELNATFYKGYENVLKDESVHLVYIATPPFLHFEISKEALLAGKHVVCEKPLATSVAEG